MRRVLVFVIVAGAIAAAVALSLSGHSRPALASRFVAPFAVHPWHNQAPPRGLRLTAPLSVPRSNGTCEIGSGRCSLSPCIDPIASAPHLPLNGLLNAPATHACRRPKAPRSRTSSA